VYEEDTTAYETGSTVSEAETAVYEADSTVFEAGWAVDTTDSNAPEADAAAPETDAGRGWAGRRRPVAACLAGSREGRLFRPAVPLASPRHERHRRRQVLSSRLPSSTHHANASRLPSLASPPALERSEPMWERVVAEERSAKDSTRRRGDEPWQPNPQRPDPCAGAGTVVHADSTARGKRPWESGSCR
jgi:hypothetical protein